MYTFEDNKLLRTKIVMTIGEPHGTIHGPDGTFFKDTVPYHEFLKWFADKKGNFIVDVIRLNMAYFTDGENERQVLNWLKSNRGGLSRYVGVLGDLPGPKIRIGDIKNRFVELARGDDFDLYWKKRRLESDTNGASVRVYDQPFGNVGSYDQVSSYIHRHKEEVIISLGDGQVVLTPEEEKNGVLRCKVAIPGQVRDLSGLTVRGLDLPLPSFGAKDQEALDFLLKHARDFLAFVGVSFVKDRDDILQVKWYIHDWLSKNTTLSREEIKLRSPSVIAKIETRNAYKNIDRIIDIADGIMVARGDLGLQFEPGEVPGIQKHIIRRCNLRGKPVITATQMLDSMQWSRRPTRAEPSDVFNAILDGTDAVLLSNETATGQFPLDAVHTMIQIAEHAERYISEKKKRTTLAEYLLVDAEEQIQDFRNRAVCEIGEVSRKLVDPEIPGEQKSKIRFRQELWQDKHFKNENQATTNLTSRAACLLAEDPKISSIITSTASGRTARMLSRFRPRTKTIAATYDPINARKLALSFGVYAFNIGKESRLTKKQFENPDEVSDQALADAVTLGYLEDGDMVIYVGGTPLMRPGTTNLIHIKRAKYIRQNI